MHYAGVSLEGLVSQLGLEWSPTKGILDVLINALKIDLLEQLQCPESLPSHITNITICLILIEFRSQTILKTAGNSICTKIS